MLVAPTLSNMTRTGGERTHPGRAVAGRRSYLGKSGPDIERETNGAIYVKLLSQIENGKKSLFSLSNSKLRALIQALEWTNRQFEEETGVPVGYDPDPIPGALPYDPSLQAPIYASVRAGLGVGAVEPEVKGYMGLDPNLPGLRGRPKDKLVVLPVNGGSMVSPKAHESIPAGSFVAVEVGAIPEQDDVVVAWIHDLELAVLKKFNEGPEVVLSSYSPRGPVFRSSEVQFDVRGVVRMVFRKP